MDKNKNPKIHKISGINIGVAIDGFSNFVILAPWCKVFHHPHNASAVRYGRSRRGKLLHLPAETTADPMQQGSDLSAYLYLAATFHLA